MRPAPALTDRDQQMLGELAELDLALARHVQARALATEDAGEVAELGRTYQRVARSLRQTLALKARLRRDSEQHARWLAARDMHREPAPEPDEVCAAAHREALEAAVVRVIWAEREYDGPDWEMRRERRLRYLGQGLDAHARQADFSPGDLDADVATLSQDLGLSRANALGWRRLPEPELDDEEDGDDDPGPPRQASG